MASTPAPRQRPQSSDSEEEELLEDRLEYRPTQDLGSQGPEVTVTGPVSGAGQVEGAEAGGPGGAITGAPGHVQDALQETQSVVRQLEENLGPHFGSGTTNVDIPNNGGGTIVVGTHYDIHYHQTPPQNTLAPTTPGGFEHLDGRWSRSLSSSKSSSTDGTEQLVKHTEDIRFYYEAQLRHNPMPWVGLLAPHFENLTTEMVIKEVKKN